MKIIEGKITSSFGERIHPVTGKNSFHNGVDIKAPVGTPVYSPIDGYVRQVFIDTNGGVTLIIGDEKIRFGFCHLSEVLVSTGDCVSKKQPIALSGNTGRSTGPHLHFTVKKGVQWNGIKYCGGEWIDPVRYIEIV